MSISNRGVNRWLVRVRKRIDGKIYNRTEIVSGTNTDAKKTEIKLLAELAETEQRSLKIDSFAEALTFYQKNTDADLTKVDTYFNRLKRDLGNVRISQLTARFTEYWRLLKNERGQKTGELLAAGTKNKILVLSKVALNFCLKRGLIEKNPLACFDTLPELGRDRVLSEAEEMRILNVMQRRKSYLYWPFVFSIKNPIRLGDLRRLRRENLDYFKPWIHFYPSKTRKRKNQETGLIFLDEGLLKYFKSLPGDCPLLFPRIDENGNWKAIGDFKKHWHSILDEAEVKDFHWHDLKHNAITFMMDDGYTENDLYTMGIQYSPEMIKRYYHGDMNKILERHKKNSGKNEVVALPCGTFDLGSQ